MKQIYEEHMPSGELFDREQMIQYAKNCLREMVKYVDDNTEIPFASTGYSPSSDTLYEEFDLNDKPIKRRK